MLLGRGIDANDHMYMKTSRSTKSRVPLLSMFWRGVCPFLSSAVR